jgi:hypothetical protein
VHDLPSTQHKNLFRCHVGLWVDGRVGAVLVLSTQCCQVNLEFRRTSKIVGAAR